MAKRGYIGFDGTARKTAKIYLGDENGLSRKITKAYIGDENGIARECFSADIKIGTLSVGSSVFMNVNGERREFLVVHQGIPDATLYDASCDGTWLLMKDLYTREKWDTTDNDYANSSIRIHLNSTFLGLLDSGIQSAIKRVKIPYHKGTGSDGSVASGSNGLYYKIFLLSLFEVGFKTWMLSGGYSVDGACLDYFKDTELKDPKRIAYYNGTARNWYLRSPFTNDTEYVWGVLSTGSDVHLPCTGSNYARPAFILPSDTLADGEFNVIS